MYNLFFSRSKHYQLQAESLVTGKECSGSYGSRYKQTLPYKK
jgi:hypothetical protein